MSIAVDPAELSSAAAPLDALAVELAQIRAGAELAVAGAAVAAGHPLVSGELDRLWARWGSALAARVADLDLLGRLLGEAAEGYRAVEGALLRSAR